MRQRFPLFCQLKTWQPKGLPRPLMDYSTQMLMTNESKPNFSVLDDKLCCLYIPVSACCNKSSQFEMEIGVSVDGTPRIFAINAFLYVNSKALKSYNSRYSG